MSIFEIIMLLCFGFAWPLSIYRSYQSRTTKGKSLFFLVIIVVGYISGICNKIINNLDFVVYLYVLNALMVSIDIGLWFRNYKIEKNNE
jgi:hypothetical protein